MIYAQSIVINSKNEISIRGSVEPSGKIETISYKGVPALYSLFNDLISGKIQTTTTANNYRWSYVLMEARRGTTKIDQYELFKQALKQRDNKWYVLERNEFQHVIYFKSKNPRGFNSTENIQQAKKMNYYQAAYFARRFRFEFKKC